MVCRSLIPPGSPRWSYSVIPAATIGEVLEIKLQRPRKRVELPADVAFNRYWADVLKFLYQRQRQPAGEAA